MFSFQMSRSSKTWKFLLTKEQHTVKPERRPSLIVSIKSLNKRNFSTGKQSDISIVENKIIKPEINLKTPILHFYFPVSKLILIEMWWN